MFRYIIPDNIHGIIRNVTTEQQKKKYICIYINHWFIVFIVLLKKIPKKKM